MDAGILKDADFAPVDDDRWKALAEKALKGAPFGTLISSSDDGIDIEPLYRRRKGARPLAVRPFARWPVLQRVDDPDAARANRQVHEDLQGGASGIAFVFEGAPNSGGFGLPAEPDTFARVLDGVALDMIRLRIDPHPASRACADWLVEYLGSRRADPSKLSLSLGIDPATTLARTGRLRMTIEALKASLPQSLAGFFAFGLPGVLLEADGRVYHNAGATEAQELGAVLSVAVGHLRMFEEARQPLVYAAPHIGFALAVDQDQYFSIAKLRALRKLWTRVQEACSIEPTEAIIHAETSLRMMTALDPESNILRSAIAAFSAAVGGADSISVLPHTLALGLPDAFARRLARNTQLILANESHLGFVADPAAGSGGMEALTDRLCEEAWEEFQRLEHEGGMMQSLVDGHLQARIAASAERRAAAFDRGERQVVGTTLYPMKAERPIHLLDAERAPVPAAGTLFCQALMQRRIDETLSGQGVPEEPNAQ